MLSREIWSCSANSDTLAEEKRFSARRVISSASIVMADFRFTPLGMWRLEEPAEKHSAHEENDEHHRIVHVTSP